MRPFCKRHGVRYLRIYAKANRASEEPCLQGCVPMGLLGSDDNAPGAKGGQALKAGVRCEAGGSSQTAKRLRTIARRVNSQTIGTIARRENSQDD